MAPTIMEEDENRSTTSPIGDSAGALGVAKQYDEYVAASFLHKDRVVSVASASNIVATSCKG